MADAPTFAPIPYGNDTSAPTVAATEDLIDTFLKCSIQVNNEINIEVDNGVNTWQSLNEVYMLTILGFVVVSGVFLCFIDKGSVFWAKKKFMPHRTPLQRPKTCFDLANSLRKFDERQLLYYCGLDGYMMLRFLKFCKDTLFISFLFGMIICIVYAQGSDIDNKEEAFKALYPNSTFEVPFMSTWTIANVDALNEDDRPLFITTIIWCWFLFIHVVFQFEELLEKYFQLRNDFLAFGDPQVHKQKRYTVMVENLPSRLRGNSELYDYFQGLFPGKVYSVTLSLKTRKIEQLLRKRNTVLTKLERKIAQMKANNGRRPQSNKYLGFVYCICLCGSVDDIDHYEKELYSLNLQLKQEKNDLFVQVAAKEEERKKIYGKSSEINYDNFKKKIELNLMLADAVMPEIYDSNKTERTKIRDHHDKTSNALDELDELEQMDNRYMTLRDSQSNSGLEFQKHLEENLSSPYLSPMKYITLKLNYLLLLLSRIVVVLFNIVRMVIPSSVVPDCIRRQVHENIMILEEYDEAVSRTGFITFTTLEAALSATQIHMSNEAASIKLKSAPEPRNIVWKNITIGKDKVKVRNFLVQSLIFLLLIVFSTAVSQIHFYADLGLQGIHDLFEGDEMNSPEYTATESIEHAEDTKLNEAEQLYRLIQQNVGPVVNLLILVLIPFVLKWISEYYECIKTKSEVQEKIISRYFYFVLASNYVGIFSSSLTAFRILIKDFRCFPQFIGQLLPDAAVFFIKLIIYKYIGLAVEISRAWNLIQIWFVQYVYDRKTLTSRDVRTGVFQPPKIMYGWIFPQFFLVFLLVTIYECITPIVGLFGWLYFWIAEIIYTYQLLYVYVPEYESGAQYMPFIGKAVLICLVTSHITLIGYLTSQGLLFEALFLIPLPIIASSIIYIRWEEKFFKPAALLALNTAKAVDNITNVVAKEQRESKLHCIDEVDDENEIQNQDNNMNNNMEDEKKDTEPNDELLNSISLISDEVRFSDAIKDFERTIYLQPALIFEEEFPEPYPNFRGGNTCYQRCLKKCQIGVTKEEEEEDSFVQMDKNLDISLSTSQQQQQQEQQQDIEESVTHDNNNIPTTSENKESSIQLLRSEL